MKHLNIKPYSDMKTWGYVEVKADNDSLDAYVRYSGLPHGGQAWAYDMVKKVKGKVVRGYHGVVENDELVPVEEYDPNTKKWNDK